MKILMTLPPACRCLPTLCLVAALGSSVVALGDEPDEHARPVVDEPVRVVEVRGFRDYDERESDQYTSTQKLRVYFEVSNITFETDDKGYFQPRLLQSARIYRAGYEKPVARAPEMVRFDDRFPVRPDTLYLTSQISMERFAPGQYFFVFEITDELADGKPASRPRRVPFEVVKAP